MRAQMFSRKPLASVKTKILLSLSALLLVVIVLVLFIVPAYISSDAGKKTILKKINDAVEGKTDFASLSMGWFKGLTVKRVTYNDSANQISVQIKQIDTKPHYLSILRGDMSFGKTVIDQPQVRIKLKPKSSQARITQTPTRKKTKSAGFPISQIDLVIKNGNFKVIDAVAGTVELAQINSKVNLRPPGEKTSFDIKTAVVAKGKKSSIHAKGSGWTFKDVSGSVQIEIDNLDIASLGPLFSLAGVNLQASGNVSVDIKTQIKNGQIEESVGKIKAKNINITGSALKGDKLQAKRLDLDIKMKTTKDTINIDKLKIRSDFVNAEITGVIPKTAKSFADFLEPDSNYDLKATFDCDIAAVLSQMPRTFKLKEQMKITSGKLNGNIETYKELNKRKIKGWINLDGLAGQVKGKQITLSQPIQAKLDITSGKKEINYEIIELSSSFCTFTASGTSKALNYEAKADLAKLQQELGQFIDMGQYSFAGQVFEKGTLSGNKDKFSVKGSAKVTGLRISKPGITVFEPQADIEFSVVVEPPKDIVTLKLMDIKAGFGQITIKDAVVPIGKEPQRPLNLSIFANVDLKKIKPFAVMFAAFPDKARIAGNAQSQVLITSQKGTYNIKTDSTKITNLVITTPDQQEPFMQEQVLLTCDVKVNPEQKTFDVVWDLVSPKIKIKGNLRKETKQNQTKLQGKADCQYDWAAVSTVASVFLPTGFNIKGQSQNKFNFQSQYPVDQPEKFMQNLSTKASLYFDSAEYMGLNFGPTKLNIQMQKGILEVAPFSTTVNKGTLSFAGQADFNKKPVLFETPGPIDIAKNIQINDETTKKLLKYVNPVFANSLNVSGVANFNCEKLAIPLKDATKNDLVVIGTIAIDDIKMQSSDLLGQILAASGSGKTSRNITMHPTRFVLQDGYLRYEEMQMDVDKKPINFKGVIGLDKSLNMTIVLPYTMRGKTVRVGQEYSGKRMEVSLGGTLDKPELNVGKLLEDQLRHQIGDKLLEKLGELLK